MTSTKPEEGKLAMNGTKPRSRSISPIPSTKMTTQPKLRTRSFKKLGKSLILINKLMTPNKDKDE